MAVENTSGGTGQPGGNPNPQAGAGSGVGGGAAGVNNPNLGTAPTVVDISDDTMVRFPGAKDPVRYGDHYKGFQSEFTKRAQEASTLRAEKIKLTQQLADQQRRLQAQQGQQQRPEPQQSKLAALAGELKSLTYLNGEQAARVVDHVMQEIQGYAGELNKRDMALTLMYRQMKQMGVTLNQLHSQHTNTEFDSKIARFVKENGLPEKATGWAKKLYLAYEGDDLDQEFPKILKEEWEGIGGVIRASEKERVEAARRQPFVPGKGGNGSPSLPLKQDWARKSAREISDALWPGMVDGEVET